MSTDPGRPAASIVIPAHNEERSIARTLRVLLATAGPGEFDVIVVPNGCTDQTAAIASAFAGVRTEPLAQPSKHAALMRGLELSIARPVVFLDADIEIDASAMRQLIEPLVAGRALASGPTRSIDRSSSSRVVRWYYDVWERLPQVQSGLFGRGVIAMSAEGSARISELPALMSDDLAIADAFDTTERVIVDAPVVIRPPRTFSDLIKRKVRSVTGNVQADRAGVRRAESKTSFRALGRLAAGEPRLIPKLPVFVGVTIAGRLKAYRVVRSGDFTTWERDDSSRQ